MDGTGQHYSTEVQLCCYREPKEVVRGHANRGADRGAEDDAGVRLVEAGGGLVEAGGGLVEAGGGLVMGEVLAGGG